VRPSIERGDISGACDCGGCIKKTITAAAFSVDESDLDRPLSDHDPILSSQPIAQLGCLLIVTGTYHTVCIEFWLSVITMDHRRIVLKELHLQSLFAAVGRTHRSRTESLLSAFFN